MEGANEAARRAVNGILEKEDSPYQPCRAFQLKEPLALAPFRFADAVQARPSNAHCHTWVGPW
jgi:hypothetical protein